MQIDKSKRNCISELERQVFDIADNQKLHFLCKWNEMKGDASIIDLFWTRKKILVATTTT